MYFMPILCLVVPCCLVWTTIVGSVKSVFLVYGGTQRTDGWVAKPAGTNICSTLLYCKKKWMLNRKPPSSFTLGKPIQLPRFYCSRIHQIVGLFVSSWNEQRQPILHKCEKNKRKKRKRILLIGSIAREFDLPYAFGAQNIVTYTAQGTPVSHTVVFLTADFSTESGDDLMVVWSPISDPSPMCSRP